MSFGNIRKSTKTQLKTLFVLTFSFLLTFYPFAPVVFAEDVAVIAESPAPIPSSTPAPIPEPTPAQTPEPIPESTPVALLTPTPTPAAEITTGNTTSVATAIAQINTTSVDSTVETTVAIVSDPTQKEITPFAPTESPASTASPTSEPKELEVTNEATTTTTATASASTGNNTQINDSTNNISTNTGDAVAIANSVAVVNTTLVNSSVQVGVVDIVSPWDGDILLDPITPTTNASSTNMGSLVASNSATVTTNATATAITGENTQTASTSAQINTGIGNAVSAARAVVNQTIVDSQIVEVLAQNLWLWSGLIYNWQYPGSVQAPSDLFAMEQDNSSCDATCNITSTNVTNHAEVVVSGEAVATTGNNTQISSGSAEMKTGNAYASATATAVVNSTLVNSRLTLLYLMLLAPWTGNLIFAYPDLVTTVAAPESVTEGSPILYQITIANIGHKPANNVAWQHSVVSEQEKLNEGQETNLNIAAGKSVTRELYIDTKGKAGKTVVINVASSLVDAEVSITNNSASAKTKVMAMTNQNEQMENDIELAGSNIVGMAELPQLSVSAKNNASNGIYPGDGVTYDVEIANTGSIDLHDTILIQNFFTPEGEWLGELRGKVGDIPVSARKLAHFVLHTGTGLPPGTYTTKTYAETKSDQGVANSSNNVENQVLLLTRVAKNWVRVASASENFLSPLDPGEVLGKTDPLPSACATCRSLPWYLAVAGGSLAYFLTTQRKRDFAKVVRFGLAIPLLGYAGLLLTQPECSNGLLLSINANYWCQWFAVYAYGIYGATAGLNGIWRRIGINACTGYHGEKQPTA